MRLHADKNKLKRPAAVAVLCASSCFGIDDAEGARPLITDDARIVDPKACQVETWTRRNRGSNEYWALPACNPTGNLELTVGGARTAQFGDMTTTALQVQGKTLFKRLEPDGWAVGLVVGHLRRPFEPHRDALANLYSYIPASFSFNHDALVIHTNVGTSRPELASQHRPTWGVGAEIELTKSLYLIPEVFGHTAGRPQYQAGVRYWIVPNRVQLDATYGDRLGQYTEGRWFSLGLRLISPPFLP